MTEKLVGDFLCDYDGA